MPTLIRPLVASFVHQQDRGQEPSLSDLLDVFVRFVSAATSRYPGSYFEFGVRDRQALLSLSDELLFVCSRRTIGRRPYVHRVPFRAFVEDDTGDRTIKRLIFFDRFSLLSDLLKQQLAENLRIDPALAWKRALWTRVNRWLKANAQPQGRVGRHPRWILPDVLGNTALDDHEIQQRLQAAGATSPEQLAELALRLAGRPLTTASVLSVISPLVSASLPLTAPPEPEPMSPELRIDVRRAVLAVWEELTEPERALLRAVAETSDFAALQKEAPAYSKPYQITRAVQRIDQRFIARLSEALGWSPEPDTLPAPRRLYATIHAVLLAVLQEQTPLADPGHLFSGSPEHTPVLEAARQAAQARALYDALFHPVLASEHGLSGSFLAAVGDAAWQADPARALAEAEQDEGLWLHDDAEIERLLDEL